MVQELFLIVRSIDKNQWMVVSNPKWGEPVTPEYLGAMIMANPFNSYVEYENTGMVYRVVRSLREYGLDQN